MDSNIAGSGKGCFFFLQSFPVGCYKNLVFFWELSKKKHIYVIKIGDGFVFDCLI